MTQNINTPESDAPLGMAGKLARSFISSPLSPLLLVSCLALGLLGLMMTPRQEDPQISVPMVDIFFAYDGASARQVASLATDPLERLMSEIPGVKHVFSRTDRHGGMVTVQFEVGEELGPSLVKLHDKIQSNLDAIPPGVSPPLIKPKGVDDVPVVTLTLWSHEVDETALRSLGLDLMQRLNEVPNTAQSFITGGRSEAIRVEIFPERLAGFDISLEQLSQTIRTANSERGVGSMEVGGHVFTLYTGAFLQSARDLESLMVGTSHGTPVYVRDVALVTEATDDVRDMVAYFTGPAYTDKRSGHGAGHAASVLAPVGAPAVTISIAKKPGSNGVRVAEDILDYVERLRGHLIPDNVNVAVTRDYGTTANEKVNELILSLFAVTIAVTVLIWLALGYRAAVVVGTVIPVVILLTIFAAWILGFTIDRVSLFALIFSIGILVDDAIVVVENIYRRWLIKGECTEECSIDAVREVGNPTVMANLTVIAALLPMGFVSGMMGPYMAPIPALGSVAVVISLFAAFIFTPWLAQRFRPPIKVLERANKSEEKQNGFLKNLFEKTLVPLIDSRLKGWIFAAALLLSFGLSLSMFYTTHTTVEMLPKDNKPEFNVVVNMPEGTALPVTANVVQQLAARVLSIPEVTALQTYTGTASPFNFNGLVRQTYLRQQPWQADIQVQLLHRNDRDQTSGELVVEARALLTELAHELGARIEVVEMPPGPPVLQIMVAEIYGPDPETRRQVARDMVAMFEAAEITVDVGSFLEAPHDAWRFVVDRDKASRRGVSVETINHQLEMVMGGYTLGHVKSERSLEPRMIYLQMPLALRGEKGRLGQLPIPSASGVMIPLSELGRFERFTEDAPIFQKNLREVEYVTGEVTGRLGAPIYAIFELEDLLDDYISPDGVRVDTNFIGPPADSQNSALEWTGEWTVTYETFRDMGLAFAVALILIYIIVVWEFGSFTMPAIIMVPIPLTLIGIVPGHWLMGASFTATSMIGFIALAGIIVRNSILLVDFSRQAVATGMSVRAAVIYACQTRTRPIILTALTLVVGAWGMIADPIFQGMAVSLMFGVMVSTVLTLIVIPLACISFPKALVAGTDIELLPEYAPEQATRVSTQLTAARRARRTSEPVGQIIAAAIISGVTAVAGVLAVVWRFLANVVRAMFNLFGKRDGGNDGGGNGGGNDGGNGAGSGTPIAPAPTSPAAKAKVTAPVTAPVQVAEKPKAKAKPKAKPKPKPKPKPKTTPKAAPAKGGAGPRRRRGIRLSTDLLGPKE